MISTIAIRIMTTYFFIPKPPFSYVKIFSIIL